LITTVGCGHREPDPDEVILYIKNARVGGGVRQQWPEGQQYLDAVMRADSEYRNVVTGLLDLRTPAGLWGTDDARWRDQEAVEQALDALNTQLTDDAAGARAQALEALTAAVGEPPSDVDPEQVWAALAWDGQDIQQIDILLPALLELARQQVALLELVQEHHDAFDQAEEKTGLAFSDAAAQEAVLAAHATVQVVIDAHQRQFAAMVLADYEDAEGQIEALNQEKETLKASADDPQKRKNLRALEDRIDYQVARRRYLERLTNDLP
jgi:hypothetical protein